MEAGDVMGTGRHDKCELSARAKEAMPVFQSLVSASRNDNGKNESMNNT